MKMIDLFLNMKQNIIVFFFNLSTQFYYKKFKIQLKRDYKVFKNFFNLKTHFTSFSKSLKILIYILLFPYFVMLWYLMILYKYLIKYLFLILDICMYDMYKLKKNVYYEKFKKFFFILFYNPFFMYFPNFYNKVTSVHFWGNFLLDLFFRILSWMVHTTIDFGFWLYSQSSWYFYMSPKYFFYGVVWKYYKYKYKYYRKKYILNNVLNGFIIFVVIIIVV